MNERRLNEHGLFVHDRALRTIEATIRHGQVGFYPAYLVGLALPESRGGPAVIALLTLPDGGVLHACARIVSNRRINIGKSLLGDAEFLDGEGLEQQRRYFFDTLGGFSRPCLDASPTSCSEQMLRSVFLGLEHGPSTQASPLGPPESFPSDWKDIVWYSRRAIGCAVEGFAPSPDLVASLDVPDALRRALVLRPSPGLNWLTDLRPRLAQDVHPRVSSLIEEAWTVQLLSRQGSVALLRSAAELIAASQSGVRRRNLNEQVRELSQRWERDPPDRTPAGRRLGLWRSRVLAHLDTIRDIGNRIHGDSDLTATDVDHAHKAMKDLVEAVLHAGPLDGYDPQR